MLRIIGDVHGRIHELEKIKREWDILEENHHPTELRVIKGNHDTPEESQLSLGDYGDAILGGVEFFFVRGAWSIDKKYRTPGLDWFPEEQLSRDILEKALAAFAMLRPQIVITHDAPYGLYPRLVHGRVHKNQTAEALQAMFEIHKPHLWIFGHHHQSLSLVFERCAFRCLDELEVMYLGQGLGPDTS
jgi:Icc-related predicted phosphoesterase